MPSTRSFVTLFKFGATTLALTAWTSIAWAAFPPPPVPPTQPLAALNIAESDVASYRPFTIKARFTKSYCLSDFPGFADVTLRGSMLNVQISHLNAGVCTVYTPQQERSIRINGLPAGNYQVRVALTATNGGQFTPPVQIVEADSYEVEAGQVNLEVKKLPGESQQGLCMAQFPVAGRTASEPNRTAIGLQPRIECAGNLIDVVALEVGTFVGKRAGAFLAYLFSSSTEQTTPTDPLFQRLYILPYPAPLAGRYATVSATTCARLVTEWGLDSATCGDTPFNPRFYVLSARNGACPLGSSPVYQLFHPGVVAHRYTQNADTYSHLMNYGYVGEGVVWCAPSRE